MSNVTPIRTHEDFVSELMRVGDTVLRVRQGKAASVEDMELAIQTLSSAMVATLNLADVGEFPPGKYRDALKRVYRHIPDIDEWRLHDCRKP